MQHLGDTMHHFRLILRMGQASGTDVVAVHRKGHLTQQKWAEMIYNCRGCGWADKCPDWLDKHETVDSVPQTCRNQQQFASLKRN